MQKYNETPEKPRKPARKFSTGESGERRAEGGERREESGEWRVEGGEWRVESGEVHPPALVMINHDFLD